MPCACFLPCPLPKHNSQQPSSIDREDRFPFINARSTYWSCSCHVESQEIGTKKCLPFHPTVTPVDSMLFTLRDPEKHLEFWGFFFLDTFGYVCFSMSKGFKRSVGGFSEIWWSQILCDIFCGKKHLLVWFLSLFYGVSVAKWWYFQEGLVFFSISFPAEKKSMTWTKGLHLKHGWTDEILY